MMIRFNMSRFNRNRDLGRGPDTRLTEVIRAQCKKGRGHWLMFDSSPGYAYACISVPGRGSLVWYYFKVPLDQVDLFIENLGNQFRNESGHRWSQSVQRMSLLGFVPVDYNDLPKRDDW